MDVDTALIICLHMDTSTVLRRPLGLARGSAISLQIFRCIMQARGQMHLFLCETAVAVYSKSFCKDRVKTAAMVSHPETLKR